MATVYTPNLYLVVWRGNNTRMMKIFTTQVDAERECDRLVTMRRNEQFAGKFHESNALDLELVILGATGRTKIPEPPLPASIAKILEGLQELKNDPCLATKEMKQALKRTVRNMLNDTDIDIEDTDEDDDQCCCDLRCDDED